MSAATESSLIDALRRPGALGVGRVPVEVLETHISWVLLAGDFAFKLKKPLDLGFLDFSTLDKRYEACCDELRLNRRLAPDLYLGVVALTGSPESPAIDGTGETLEYAVKMRRFAQDRLLSELLRTGQVSSSLVDAIADEVAAFHQSLPGADRDSPWGTPDAVWGPVAENFRHIDSTPLAHRHGSELEQLLTWSEQEQHAKRDAIAARKAEGFVRECHGDMHLGNMVAENGRVTVFDCLEFNAALRWIDTASEVAFLAMDLTDRGASHFAARAVNRYLQITGDYGALGVLRFYLVYRAMVRAKVNAIRCQQERAEGIRDETALTEAAGYLRLASEYTTTSPPYVAITFGLSGSGKTTYTQPLLERTGAIRIRSDVERKRLAGISARADSGSALDSGLYTPAATRETYARLLELCRLIVTEGWPVIVDATFLQESRRQPFRKLADELGLPFVILDFQASRETLEQRIEARARRRSDASEATLEVLHRQLERVEPLTPAERPHALSVDTEASPEDGAWIDGLLERT